MTPWTVGHQAPEVHGILQTRVLEWVTISLLQEIFWTQGPNPGLLHCRQMLYCVRHQGSPKTSERKKHKTTYILTLKKTMCYDKVISEVYFFNFFFFFFGDQLKTEIASNQGNSLSTSTVNHLGKSKCTTVTTLLRY